MNPGATTGRKPSRFHSLPQRLRHHQCLLPRRRLALILSLPEFFGIMGYAPPRFNVVALLIHSTSTLGIPSPKLSLG
jgi:hypothetical protein